MPAMDPVFQRVNALCERLISTLQQADAGTGVEWRIDRGITKDAFAISRKGTKASPNANGRSWHRVGGISYRDLVTIANTSSRDDDAIDRIKRRLLTGEDTTLASSSVASSDALNAEIERRVAAEVQRVLANAKNAQQVKQPKIVTRLPSKTVQSMAVWTERCKLMGVDPPLPRPSDATKIDGRFLRRLEPLWQAYEDAHQPQS